MIDKKLRLFGKVSLVDIGFIALLAAFLWMASWLSAPQAVSAQPGGVPIRLTAEISRRELDFLEHVHIGDTVFDVQRGFPIGTIVDVYTAPYRDEVPDLENGVIRRTIVKGMHYVYIVMEASATVTDSATAVGQFEVMVGRQVFIRTRGFAGAAIFVSLEHLE